MPPDLPAAHRFLEFMSPLSGERADALVGFLADHASGVVVDVGCGWAALLIRLLQAGGTLRGRGLDLDDQGFAQARSRAEAQGVADRLELIAGDARAHRPAGAGGAICIGASQVWGPPVEAAQPLDYAAALSALRAMVERGAPVVYGEAIWSRPPTAAAAAPLSGRLDEFVALPDLLDLAEAAGFVVVQVHEASQDEWDRFESGYTARLATWLATHDPSDPEFDVVRGRLQRQQQAYHRGYRGILGMAYLGLLAA